MSFAQVPANGLVAWLPFNGKTNNEKTTKISDFINFLLIFLFFNFFFFTSNFLRAQSPTLTMDLEWLSSTTNTADFQVRLTNTSTIPYTFNAVILRGNHAANITTGTISWKALNDNTLPGWLSWPNTGTDNLPYNATTRQLNFSSSVSIFTSVTAPNVPTGSGVIIGTFRMSTTTTWTPNSNFGFVWAATGAVNNYIAPNDFVTSFQQTGSSGTTICGSCLTVTTPSEQLLNPQIIPPPSSSVLSGDSTICEGNSTNLSVAVTDGTAPYTVTVTDGTNNYSATGASPVSIPVSPTTTSTYSIVSVTGGGTGTGNTGSATVTVVPAPVATISYTGSPWCSTSTSQTVTQTGTPGGTYSSTTGLSINSSTGTITPSTSTAGTYTVTYTIAAASPCAALSVTTSVTIKTAPSATISYANSIFCSSSSTPESVTQTGTSGGTYSSTTGLTLDASTGAITPSTSTIGAYTVTYTLAAFGACPGVSAITTIIIAEPPSASISYVGAPFCKSLTAEQPVTQIGPTGGTYSASPAGLSINESTGAITPSTSTATSAVVVYTVTYSVAASSGCPAVSATTTVSIGPIPSGTISYAGNPFCKTLTPAINVSRSTVPASGGTYTRVPTSLLINPSTGQLSAPNTQTAGIYTVTLTLTNVQTGGCGITTFNAPVTISAVPTAVISYVGAPFCKTITTDRAVTLTGTTEGTYSASPAGLSISSSTGAITPSTSTAGTYTVSYTTPSGTGCTPITATASVTITTPPSATISYVGSPFCKTLTTAQSVTSTGSSGGTYTASPTGLSISSSTGAITPSASSANTYTVTYTTPSGTGCTPITTIASVIITAAPVAGTLSGTQSVCSNATTTFSSSTVGGTWTSGTTSIATINPSTGVISPVGAGTATMTYTVTGGPGCANATGTRTVTVTALPSATISYAGSPFCKNLTTAQPVTITGTAGGAYTSTTGLSINSSTGAVTPSSSTAGTYAVTYTLAATGGCSAVTTTATVIITAAPAATISYSGTPWCASSTADQSVNQGGTTGGAYSSTTGLSINSSTGVITPSTSTAGTYTVSYTIAAAVGCAEVVATTNATITATPSQPAVACYQTATFNATTCSWDLSGTQPIQPTGLACYETATFNTTSCSWVVSGTQPAQPTLACYETATFNTISCSWVVSGTQPAQPTIACYETAAFNATTCVWAVSGTQPVQPTGLACYETAAFNTSTCAWDVTGTQPTSPTGLECYETATFNATSCSWVVSGTQPVQPTLACYQTAAFITTTCTWVISGPQAPQKMSYQAVIRNSNDSLLIYTPVGMRISLVQGAPSGIVVFSETQAATTNSNGLVSLQIGMGTVVTGTFACIDWASGPYYVKTETDLSGGTNYTIISSNELLSVPYALFSANGTPGPSAYQVAVANGFIGTETQWLESLQGTNGTNGETGATGPAGTFPPGTVAGEMNYWNGTAWVTVAPGLSLPGDQALTLSLCNGVPTWGPCPAVLPTVTTTGVFSITNFSASSGGAVTSNGGAALSAWGVCWSTSANPTLANSFLQNTVSSGSFSSALSGLTQNTTYYVRAYATNSAGTAYGDEQSFTTTNTTTNVVLPTITTFAVSAITTTSASSGGAVTSDGGAALSAWGVCWSTSANPILANSFLQNNGSAGFFSSALSGLAPNTTYYLRAYATNSAGTAYGNEQSFTTTDTNAVLPTITTIAVSAITTSSAIIGSTITSDGGATLSAWGVCWSTSPNPTLANSFLQHNVSTTIFGSALSGLTQNTTYYVRAYATNSAGTAYGNELSFTTLAIVIPIVTTTAITSITSTSANSGGTLTYDGGATVSAWGVCWSTFANPTLANSFLQNTVSSGSFSSALSGLTLNTTYYVRAFATNSAGTAYGNEQIFTTTSNLFAIGQSYQGGIVAYIDSSGTHGLIAAPSDLGGAPWGCSGTEISGADGTAIGTGNQNTIDIMTGCSEAGIAARLCGDLVLGGYSDWYLPSKDELNQLYINRFAIGGFASNFYWSSTEYGSSSVLWVQNFNIGAQDYVNKYYNLNVRAVRAF
jgi:hypothetical protein